MKGHIISSPTFYSLSLSSQMQPFLDILPNSRSVSEQEFLARAGSFLGGKHRGGGKFLIPLAMLPSSRRKDKHAALVRCGAGELVLDYACAL